MVNANCPLNKGIAASKLACLDTANIAKHNAMDTSDLLLLYMMKRT